MLTKLFYNWSTPYYCATLHLNTQRQRVDIKLIPTHHTSPLASFDNSRVDRKMASNEIMFVMLMYPQLVDERSEEAVGPRKR